MQSAKTEVTANEVPMSEEPQVQSVRDRIVEKIAELRAMATRLVADTTAAARTIETRAEKLAGTAARVVEREPIGTAAALFAAGFAIGYVFWLRNGSPPPPRRRYDRRWR